MDRTQQATAVNERFVGPDPSQGRRGTILGEQWVNGVQEELVGIIEAAGIEPDAAQNDQVRKALISLIYPINSIYITYGTLTPAQLFDVGTWAEIGEGRVLVGRDTGQTEFNTIGKTGGAKTHQLTVGEMPAHRHNMQGDGYSEGQGPVTEDKFLVATGDHFHRQYTNTTDVQLAGGGLAHNNLQPYLTVRMWRRTA